MGTPNPITAAGDDRAGFLGLDPKTRGYDVARVAVLPIPYDATTSFGGGARLGPSAIISASQQVELYDEALGRDSSHVGVTTLPPVDVDVSGPESMMRRIESAARRPVEDGKFLLGLGGEHSVTLPLVRAVRRRWRDVSVLQLDAHADLRDAYQGSPYSHACVMRRLHGEGVKFVGVGIRSYSEEEAELIAREGLSIFPPRACHGEAWIEQTLAELSDEVFVTVDIDGFDPAYAPGTGTPEPGGLDWFQVTDLLAALARSKRIVGADVVEVAPATTTHVTEFLAARLAYRIIGLAAEAFVIEPGE